MTTLVETRPFMKGDWLTQISSSLTASVRAAIELGAGEVARAQAVRRVSPATATIVDSSPVPTEFELRVHAVRTLFALMSSGRADPSSAALDTFQRTVDLLVREGGPTPQVGDTATGSVEIQWLVKGELVSALFAPSGELNIYAEDASGDVLLDIDFAQDADLEPMADSLRSRLAAMGSRASARLALTS